MFSSSDVWSYRSRMPSSDAYQAALRAGSTTDRAISRRPVIAGMVVMVATNRLDANINKRVAGERRRHARAPIVRERGRPSARPSSDAGQAWWRGRGRGPPKDARGRGLVVLSD